MGEVRLSAHFLWKVSDLRILTLETVEEMPLAGERLELPTLRFKPVQARSHGEFARRQLVSLKSWSFPNSRWSYSGFKISLSEISVGK